MCFLARANCIQILLSKINKSQLKYMHPYSRWISNHYCKLSSVFTHENHLHSRKYIHTHKRLSCNFALVPHVEWETKKKCKLYSGTKWHGSKEINAKGKDSVHHPLKKTTTKKPHLTLHFHKMKPAPKNHKLIQHRCRMFRALLPAVIDRVQLASYHAATASLCRADCGKVN